jgi:hypothetical protein
VFAGLITASTSCFVISPQTAVIVSPQSSLRLRMQESRPAATAGCETQSSSQSSGPWELSRRPAENLAEPMGIAGNALIDFLARSADPVLLLSGLGRTIAGEGRSRPVTI